MQHQSILSTALSELRENRWRYEAHISQLRDVLLATFDDHTGALADWDWQWPQHERLALKLNAWRKARESAPPQTAAEVESLYASLAFAPRIDRWIETWDRNIITTLRFLNTKLHEDAGEVMGQFGRCEELLELSTAST